MVMFEDHDSDSPKFKGSTIVTRQSEGSGLGLNGSHVFHHNFWFWDRAPYNTFSMANPRAVGPATSVEVAFVVLTSGGSYSLAQVYDGAPVEAHDDIVIWHQGVRVPLTGQPPRYRILIDASAQRFSTSTQITFEMPIEPDSGQPDNDAAWEEAKIRIMELEAVSDPAVATLFGGWHSRRFLMANSIPNPTPPASQSINNCQATLTCTPMGPTGCTQYKNIDFRSDPVLCQVGHTTPETSRLPIANCPGGTQPASGHCQVSTKILAEGANSSFHSKYMGFRFTDEDKQSASHTVCGCDTITDDVDEIYVELEITGDAIPAEHRTQFMTANHDYYLDYRNGQTTSRHLTVTDANGGPPTGGPPYYTTVEIRSGDVDTPACLSTFVPFGFGVIVNTFGDDDTHDPGNFEFVELRVVRMWDGDSDPDVGTQIANPFGWNNIARFVIEEGSPN